MPLSKRNKTILSHACPDSITKTFQQLIDNWGQDRWLLVQNRYSENCIKKLEKDSSSKSNVVHKHLKEYIAASCIIHCMDGWSYLGRSIEAHLRGDRYTALHLAYYAELRAAVSLLASQGIGIFDNRHFIVNKRMQCETLPDPSRTHQFTWEAFEFWAETIDPTNTVFRAIKPGGLPLSTWLEQFFSGITPAFSTLVANEWLKKWGLDLKHFTEDRQARNHTSYRPTVISNSSSMDVNDALDFVIKFWEICEPSESNPFSTIDRHLLRQCLENLFYATSKYKKWSIKARQDFGKQIDKMLDAINPTDLSKTQWLDFLSTRTSSNTPLLITEANKSDASYGVRYHVQVLARSTLLLRVAMGLGWAQLEALRADELSRLKFWSTSLGEDRALWHSGTPPGRFIDLWADIADAIIAIDGWRNGASRAELSYNKLWTEQSSSAALLGSCERIGLWGILG